MGNVDGVSYHRVSKAAGQVTCIDGVGANNSRNVKIHERKIRPTRLKSTRSRPKATSPTPTTAPTWVEIGGGVSAKEIRFQGLNRPTKGMNAYLAMGC